MIKKLDWDSDFFGYPVGVLKAKEYPRQQHRTFLREAKDYRLVYIFLDHSIARKPKGFRLVDKKAVFVRRTEQVEIPSGPGRILRFRGKPDRALIRLAMESGKYSRFKTDPGFNGGEFRRLYAKWIENSVSGISAKATYVCRFKEETAGFVTLQVEGRTASIGLIAVSGKYRGKGIGTALVLHAVRKAFDFGCGAITVATQLDNDPAVRLYLSNGFKLGSVKMIYHYRAHR
ncbi:GNAT family N-acetyltransferase [bacterium]|nr:GNAT family N-acetyltransferase [bacterium]